MSLLMVSYHTDSKNMVAPEEKLKKICGSVSASLDVTRGYMATAGYRSWAVYSVGASISIGGGVGFSGCFERENGGPWVSAGAKICWNVRSTLKIGLIAFTGEYAIFQNQDCKDLN